MEIREKELSAFIEKIGSPVLICGADGRICSCNSKAAHLLGTSRKRVAGKFFPDLSVKFFREDGTLMPWEELPQARVLADLQPRTDKIVGLRPAASSSIIWTRIDAQPEFSEDGAIRRIVLSLADVTAEKGRERIQKRIQLAKDEWEKTVDAIQDVVMIIDPQLRVIRANKTAHLLSGSRYGELTGKKCYDVLRGEGQVCKGCPAWNPEKEAEISTGLIYNKALEKTFEVSSSPIFAEDGKVEYLVHTGRDVTQKLKDEEERLILSAAIEQISEVVIITDGGGTIQYVNPAFTARTGYSRSEAIGCNPRILKSGEHDQAFYKQMWDTLSNGMVWNGQLINKKKNGSLFWEDVTISPVFDGEGQIQHYVAVKRDISKERSLERQLRHAMKMEAIGTLAGGITHDFNNILSVMIGYGQMAKERLAGDSPAAGDIDEILWAGDRAVDLVKQILIFSRSDKKEQFKWVPIQHMIKEFIKFFRSTLPVTVELQYDIKDDCRPIFADSGQIYQVLMNLCTNAKQAIGDAHGTISVTLQERNVTRDDYQIVNLLRGPGDYAELEIRDSGCGMTADLQERIFEPFFTTKAKDQGTGLGLAVVHGIVQKHGGGIEVNSTVGRGTTFHVYFPVQTGIVDIEPDDDEPELLVAPTTNGRIMVVDDDEVIARLFEKMLRKLGYTVTIFTDSIEAVSRFRSHPDDYDLVLTDMTMPKMTGAELTREVLSLRPKLPVIMSTGYSEIIDREKAQRLGIKEFLLKPVKKEKLARLVKKVLEHG